ncbi:uncharacterized protein LOC129752147 [Uranotaenia lowii]|uniref:uncharacterized protein LOC129752147 n=1 Tax=Uranotaenia lowii TaxID=190385 RepID=UPI002478E31E|nr:uncharacterized protein LOC129752147 [Uranotaenia lowii]
MEESMHIQQLQFRRTTLLASLSRAEQFIHDFSEERDMLEVKIRLENLDAVWEGLEAVQTELEAIENDNESRVRNLGIRASFEPILFKIKGFLLSKIPDPINLNCNPPQAPPYASTNSLKSLNLPTISLPTFAGDYQDWLGFHDTFVAMIHDNHDVPDIQKFHYLKAAVKGEASQVIESFGLSAINYRLAWEALVKRYANEYLLRKRNIQALFESPKMFNESASELRGVVDEFERHVKVLGQLREPVGSWSSLLEHLLCSRLHADTLTAWEDHASTLNEPTYANLIDFLQRRTRVLESVDVNRHQTHSILETPYFESNLSVNMTSNAATDFYQFKCYACEQHHTLVKCPRFGMMNPSERLNVVNSKRLCLNCFRSGHLSRSCSSKYNCRICRRRHHTLLHASFPEHSHPNNHFTHSQVSNVASIASDCSGGQTSDTNTFKQLTFSQCSVPADTADKTIFMLTAIVIIIDRYGKSHYARALLDSASQPNIISERLVQILRLKRKRNNMAIHGIGELPQNTNGSVCTQIRSRKTKVDLNVEFLILEKLTSVLPSHNVNVNNWNLPKDIFLADPHFNVSAEIDLIIGCEHFFACFETAERIYLEPNLPTLVDSIFGWLVCGAAAEKFPKLSDTSAPKSITAVSLHTLEESMERFWKIEEVTNQSPLSKEEQQCERMYTETFTRNSDGRYVVRLPRHENFNESLGDSEGMARRRFIMLEKKLQRDPQLNAEYHDFMREYLELGHMRLVSVTEKSNSYACYLPHHPVLKESSSTTKLRVVFDASAKTSTGNSLNEALLVGPVVQDDLLSIVMRFRTYPVAVVADIEKMYRQIWLHSADTPCQRILWRFDSDGPLHTYELQTVTYGLGPSSFLATRTLQQVIQDESERFPVAAANGKINFYMDDFIGGAETVSEAIKLREELSEMLQKGGFCLRKFASNRFEVLKDLTQDKVAMRSFLDFDKEEAIKTLGIYWEPEKDLFGCNVSIRDSKGSTTKRQILSSISQLYDPLGLISPIVIRGKMLMQRLWLQSCGWDEPINGTVAELWSGFIRELPGLREFRVSRYAFLPESTVQIHVFSDASESAYGACAYARSLNKRGEIKVQLLASKSRVAPLKKVTLPRLELCAANIAAELHLKVIQALRISVAASFFWSDSTVTLQWIKAPPHCWKTFIANRVSNIQTLTKGAQWNHVSGLQNPADHVSRGLDVESFLKCQSWKFGPEWLSNPEEMWPKMDLADYPMDGKERRKTVVAVVKVQASYNPMFERYGSYIRLLRVTALMMRFANNCRRKYQAVHTITIELLPTTDDVNQAETRLVKLAQRDAFQLELAALKKSLPVSTRSPIRLLSPYLDNEMIIRVGGRLQLSDQPYLSKHPALLPASHPFTRLLIIHFHIKLIHGGGRLTLAAIRERFWPINGRRTVRSIIRMCYRCTRASPVPEKQQMGQLPASRITPSRPFSTVGVDYAGPVYLKAIHKRAEATKAYISVFICFVTKAVHLELVGDLSTPSFLCALRRFIGRRGFPSDIYSDNGKNFVGGNNELQALHHFMKENQKDIHTCCVNKGINWHWSPPKGPHFGGLWEAAVKVAKRHMYRQLGNIKLSFEDMCTLLVEIEAAMNSRPIVSVSEDPNDVACLTPAHFLIGTNMQTIAEPDYTALPSCKLDHYQAMQRTFQQFWSHWRSEYLQELQKCTVLNKPNKNIRPGRLVLIVDEFQHPVKWPLARILSIHPGADSLTRVVTLKTSKGTTSRPITKICLLPLEDGDEAESAESSENSEMKNKQCTHSETKQPKIKNGKLGGGNNSTKIDPNGNHSAGSNPFWQMPSLAGWLAGDCR